MKYSIIIPIYNSEKYLKQCIDSVLSQTHKDFELILIDDESQDSSPQICDCYAEQDKRITVIHQKNGGTSHSRNTGLKCVTGDYTMFLDNDDYWNDCSCLEKIDKQLEESNVDVLMFAVAMYWDNTQTYEPPKTSCKRCDIVGYDKVHSIKYLIQKGLFYRAVWSKVIKTGLIKDNKLYFKQGIRNEDTDWSSKLMLCAKSYDWYEGVFYVYRKNHTNAQTSKPNSYKTVLNLKDILIHYINYGKNHIKDKSFRNVFFSYLAYPYAVWMGQSQFFKGDLIKKDIFEMKKYAFILRCNEDPTVKLVSKLYKITGYTITSKILMLYFKLNQK